MDFDGDIFYFGNRPYVTGIRLPVKEELKCGLSPMIRSLNKEFSIYSCNESYIIDLEFCHNPRKNQTLCDMGIENLFLNEIGFSIERYMYHIDSPTDYSFWGCLNNDLRRLCEERFPYEEDFILWLRHIKNPQEYELTEPLLRLFDNCEENKNNQISKDFLDML